MPDAVATTWSFPAHYGLTVAFDAPAKYKPAIDAQGLFLQEMAKLPEWTPRSVSAEERATWLPVSGDFTSPWGKASVSFSTPPQYHAFFDYQMKSWVEAGKWATFNFVKFITSMIKLITDVIAQNWGSVWADVQAVIAAFTGP